MPLRILRFCRQCLMTQQAFTRQHCSACGGELVPLLDENGAISRDFLTARGSCCSNGCRNCPYESPKGAGEACARCSTEKTCPRCAATFACQSMGCWCNDVHLSPATLEWLERQYENCLCPACLASFASC